MKLNEKGLLIVISGPSGVGKGTIRKALFQRTGHNLDFSVSMTTRMPREGEIDGKDYFFVTKEEFEQEIKNDNLLEHAKFVNNYYGTPKNKVLEKLEEGKEVVYDVLFTFDSEETNKSYIVYTDNTLDEDGNIQVYASTYQKGEGTSAKLDPIETDKEWKIIETILNTIQETVKDKEENAE